MKMIVGIDDLNRVSTAIDPGSLLYYLDSDIQLPLPLLGFSFPMLFLSLTLKMTVE